MRCFVHTIDSALMCNDLTNLGFYIPYYTGLAYTIEHSFGMSMGT
jgi:hypothetical protein